MRACEVVGNELVVSRRDTPTLLDLVEEPFDESSRTIQIRAEAGGPKGDVGAPIVSKAGLWHGRTIQLTA
jgi:hypothetical protein